MAPLRIAVVCEYPSVNGGERSLLAVIDALPDDEFEFVLCAPPRGPFADELARRDLEHIPFDVRDESGQRLPRPASIVRLRAAMQSARPQLVHANSLAMGRLTGAAELGLPSTAHLRDILNLSAAAIADLNRNRRLVAVSRRTRDHHVSQGLDAALVDVIYNGIDCRTFAPRPAADSLKQQLGLPQHTFLAATIGQIGLRKGIDVLAEAAVRHRDALPHVHYIVIGERHSSKDETVQLDRSLSAIFAAAGMAGRLHRLGRRNDVPQLLNEVDLLIHPARQEPFGRVLLEAAASGVPIVATDTGGTREMLPDESAAWLVPPNDATALAAAIREACLNQDARAQRSTNARDIIESRFAIADRAAELGRFWIAASNS